jgi:hypothetical protein
MPSKCPPIIYNCNPIISTITYAILKIPSRIFFFIFFSSNSQNGFFLLHHNINLLYLASITSRHFTTCLTLLIIELELLIFKVEFFFEKKFVQLLFWFTNFTKWSQISLVVANLFTCISCQNQFCQCCEVIPSFIKWYPIFLTFQLHSKCGWNMDLGN